LTKGTSYGNQYKYCNRIAMGKNVFGSRAPLNLALLYKISRKQRRNSGSFRCYFICQTLGGPGFPPKMRCRWLKISVTNSKTGKNSKNSQRRRAITRDDQKGFGP